MHICNAKSLFILAMVLAIGQALRVPEWANSLATRLDHDVNNIRSEIIARVPKGGKGGHSDSGGSGDSGSGSSGSGSGSGSSGSGSGSGSGSCGTDYTVTTNCLSSEKICGKACIPSSATCCTLSSGTYSSYCLSTETCMSISSSSYYKCCPSFSSTCTSTSLNANYASTGNVRYGTKNCASGGASGANQLSVSRFAVGAIGAVFIGEYVRAQI